MQFHTVVQMESESEGLGRQREGQAGPGCGHTACQLSCACYIAELKQVMARCSVYPLSLPLSWLNNKMAATAIPEHACRLRLGISGLTACSTDASISVTSAGIVKNSHYQYSKQAVVHLRVPACLWSMQPITCVHRCMDSISCYRHCILAFCHGLISNYLCALPIEL